MSRLFIALGIFAASCTTSYGGELSAAACSNGSDDDGDRLLDCEDPDCQVFAPCAVLLSGPSGDGGRDHGRDAGGRDGGTPRPTRDAGTHFDSGVGTAWPPPDDDDAGALPGDSGTAAHECDPACEAPEVCVEGSCQAPPMGEVVLTLTAVGVPDQNDIAKCFDDTCGPVPSPPFGFCTCPPDAFVRLTRVRAGEETDIGRTATAIDTREPDFTDMPMTATLLPDDVLRAYVLDEDETGDQELYKCDISPLPAVGHVECSRFVHATLFKVEVELSAPAGP